MNSKAASPKTGAGWTETVLHAFHSVPHGSDGYLPFSGVTLDAAGNLYGTTLNGGSSTFCPGFGCGIVYKLSPTTTGPWKETILHTFTDGPDGAYPWGGVAVDSNGNLYGTAQQGGDLSACEAHGCGTVFRIAKP